MTPKPGSMGKPAPGFDIILVGKNYNVCGVGEEGEIVIKTDKGKPVGLFTDYHLDPDKTKNIWHDDYTTIQAISPGEMRMDTFGSLAAPMT